MKQQQLWVPRAVHVPVWQVYAWQVFDGQQACATGIGPIKTTRAKIEGGKKVLKTLGKIFFWASWSNDRRGKHKNPQHLPRRVCACVRVRVGEWRLRVWWWRGWRWRCCDGIARTRERERERERRWIGRFVRMTWETSKALATASHIPQPRFTSPPTGAREGHGLSPPCTRPRPVLCLRLLALALSPHSAATSD